MATNPSPTAEASATAAKLDSHTHMHPLSARVSLLMSSLARMPDDLSKYEFLCTCMAIDPKLFYAAALAHPDIIVPIAYTPTVGRACTSFSTLPLPPQGLFITLDDLGRVEERLATWPSTGVRAIVVTDGERILGLGDLGANGMGIPIGKLALYTALGGVDPSVTLPITLDVGTNNAALRKDPHYIGVRTPRVTGEKYDALVEEVVLAAQRRYGKDVLVQFEDFGSHNAFRLMREYANRAVSFNDDIQGTASVVVAGFLSATRITGSKLREGTYVFYGAGEAGTGIAELMCYAMAVEDAEASGAVLDPADLQTRAATFRSRVWLVDSKGLVVASRRDEPLAAHKLPFAHDATPVSGLANIIRHVRPTALIGVSAQPAAFGRDVVTAMCESTPRPLIFALSNPTSKSECTAQQAYEWSDGAAIFASGSPFDPVQVTLSSGEHRMLVPGQGNNSYIFPAVGLAVVATHMTKVDDHTMYVAARALAQQVTDADLEQGSLYPSLRRIREVSAGVATAVAQDAYARGTAALARPADLPAFIRESMWKPE